MSWFTRSRSEAAKLCASSLLAPLADNAASNCASLMRPRYRQSHRASSTLMPARHVGGALPGIAEQQQSVLDAGHELRCLCRESLRVPRPRVTMLPPQRPIEPPQSVIR